MGKVDIPLDIPEGCPIPPRWPPPPDWWDVVWVALSDGKDSRVVLDLAVEEYGRERVRAIYHLLGDEHPGSPQEARVLCDALGVGLTYTWKERRGGHLVSCFGDEMPEGADLDVVVELSAGRGMWPAKGLQYCTSSGKRDAGNRAFRDDDMVSRLALDRRRWPSRKYPLCSDRSKASCADKLIRCEEVPNTLPHEDGKQILLLTGERAEESPSRAKRGAWSLRKGATSPQKQRLVLWHRPVLDWTEAQIWGHLRAHESPAFPASYAEGFSRHSCRFCVLKGRHEMILAFLHYPERAALRVAVEEEIGHKVRLDYLFCECGCIDVKSVKRTLVCRNCGKPADQGYQGFRALWEFVYGPWSGMPAKMPDPRPEAVTAVDRWRTEGLLFRLEDWWQ